MNQTLVQNPFQLGYSVAPEGDYQNYFNASTISSDDLQPFTQRHALTSHQLAHPIAGPSSHDIRYGVPLSTMNHSAFQTTSNLLLSPPDSCSGSVAASANSTSSSFAYSSLPTLFPNNATSADHYSSASSSCLPPPWNEKNMAEYGRPRGPALPPPSLSPPLSYGVTHPMPGSLYGTGRSLNDPYTHGMTRLGLNHNYSSSHEILRYSNQYPQAQRATDTYPFSSTNSTYHQPTMPLEPSTRPASTRLDGPPFDDTTVIHPVITSRNHQLTPDIAASIQKGFFQVDGKWTCYRRNYFTVSCSFNFRSTVSEGPLYLQRHSNHPAEAINQFAVSISAKTAIMNTNQESEVRALVQHTPKRDKATETIPGKVTVQPAPTLSLASSGALSVNGNLYANSQQVSPGLLADYGGTYSSTQHQTPPTSHTFERIQFQKATANNGKRRAQQQYFHIVVELSADIGRPGESAHWVKIATRQSEPMVVRGRSPGHYKDNGRRDSTTSMDPDRGSGPSGDPGAGLGSMNSLLGSSRSHPSSMDWEPSHRHRGNMGGGYRRVEEANCSPHSDLSEASMSASPPALGTPYQALYSTVLSDRDRASSTLLPHGDLFGSIDLEPKGGPSLSLRNCGADLTLPKPSCSSAPLDFGIHGTQHFDMHGLLHSHAVCST